MPNVLICNGRALEVASVSSRERSGHHKLDPAAVALGLDCHGDRNVFSSPLGLEVIAPSCTLLAVVPDDLDDERIEWG